MGVVNVTPDSFSDGGTFDDDARPIAPRPPARRRGRRDRRRRRRVDAPRRAPVPAEEELAARDAGRGGPRRPRRHVSIDTIEARRRRAALDAGASYVNDVTAFRHDPELAGLVADRGVDCCLMHMLGEPRTMQEDPRYDDVVSEVKAFLEERLAFAVAAGHPRGAGPARPRDRVRQDARAQPRAAARGWTRSRRSGGRSWSAPRASRSSAGSRAATPTERVPRDRRHERARARARGVRVPRPRRRRETRMRSRWRLLRWRADGPDDPEDYDDDD